MFIPLFFFGFFSPSMPFFWYKERYIFPVNCFLFSINWICSEIYLIMCILHVYSSLIQHSNTLFAIFLLALYGEIAINIKGGKSIRMRLSICQNNFSTNEYPHADTFLFFQAVYFCFYWPFCLSFHVISLVLFT